MAYKPELFDVHIILEKEKRALVHQVKNAVLHNDGVIFGGMVRDEIISSYYKKYFMNYLTSIGNFDNREISLKLWDTTIHDVSSARILVPNNIELFFNNKINYLKFVENIYHKFQKIKIFENIHDNHLFTIMDNSISELMTCTKIIIEHLIGKTLTFNGILIRFKITIYYLRNIYNGSQIIEPPFNCLDMICNSLIHTKNGVRLSRCTGTHLDTFDTIEKSNAMMVIMKQIANYETYICSRIHNEYNKIFIIKKMINMIDNKTGNSWKFNNAPYTIIKSINELKCDELSCCICQEDLNDDNDIAVVYVNDSNGNKIIGSRTHCKCMHQYIIYQTIRAPFNYVCPYKSELKFIDLNIDYSIYKN
jgi:hypothetical protein